jgi:hypothetical protein
VSDDPDWLGIFEGMQKTWQAMLDGMEGMVTEAKRRGYTEEQARALVAWCFGYRPPNAPESEDPS